MNMVQNVLIICIGNICRSPMAAALFLEKTNKRSLPVSISSAGLGALVNKEADPHSRALMSDRGLSIHDHRARQVTAEIIYSADIIFTMDTEQHMVVEKQYPAAHGRVHRLGEWGGYNIADPYLRPKSAFEHSLLLIEQGVQDWYEKLWGEKQEAAIHKGIA
ncbi:MAG: low molecular weight phosphotyrosine protein phosphatase [Gammaproteobacteria bacterium]|nr:low molecular weight phosphotyrosine protein phosphatase [Gammaproteobacteria bacterium]